MMGELQGTGTRSHFDTGFEVYGFRGAASIPDLPQVLNPLARSSSSVETSLEVKNQLKSCA